MVNYLKKTKMYDLAKFLYPGIPGIRKCEYKKFNGFEWLNWTDIDDDALGDGWIEYSLCCHGSYFSFEKLHHFESCFKCRTVYRYDICSVLRKGA